MSRFQGMEYDNVIPSLRSSEQCSRVQHTLERSSRVQVLLRRRWQVKEGQRNNALRPITR